MTSQIQREIVESETSLEPFSCKKSLFLPDLLDLTLAK